MLSECWSRETSNDPDNWTPENAAWGQCAVSALVIQEAVGGDLVAGYVKGVRHYWNRLEDGTEIDSTIRQFGDNSNDKTVGTVAARDYVLSNPDTYRRYMLLKRCVILKGGWKGIGR